MAVIERRASYDIYADLLYTLLQEPDISQTTLALKTDLDTRGTARHMDILLRDCLVSKQDTGNNRHVIRITGKGLEFLRQYMRLTSMLE
jgi:predicted transcriptional regulator